VEKEVWRFLEVFLTWIMDAILGSSHFLTMMTKAISQGKRELEWS
jgi:hypothetical protein